MSARSWDGVVRLSATDGIFVGNGGETPFHAHHAFKVVVPLAGEVRVESAARGVLTGPVVVVNPNEVHAMHATQSRLALVYVEPQSPLGRSIAWQERHAATRFGQRVAAEVRERVGSPHDGPLPPVQELLAAATDPASVDRLDRRVTAALARLDVEASSHVPLRSLAELVGISESRLSHLFAASLGVPVVRYRRWRRLRQAMGALGAGSSITDAAHESGFSDCAHLSRTFMGMMGITPSVFARMSVVETGRTAEEP